MKKLYFRCNGGHYFQGVSCPFDAWTMDGLADLVATFQRMTSASVVPELSSLLPPEAPSELKQRVVLMEFGDEAAAFEALAPDWYIHRGAILRWSEVGLELF